MEHRNSQTNSPRETIEQKKESFKQAIIEAIIKRITSKTSEMRYMKRNIDSKEIKTRLMGFNKSGINKKDAKQIIDKVIEYFHKIKKMNRIEYIEYVKTLRPKYVLNYTKQIANMFRAAQRSGGNNPRNPMAPDRDDDNHYS